MNEVLLYIVCRSVGIIPRVVPVPSDFVADILSVIFVFYYAVDGILFRSLELTAISLS